MNEINALVTAYLPLHTPFNEWNEKVKDISDDMSCDGLVEKNCMWDFHTN